MARSLHAHLRLVFLESSRLSLFPLHHSVYTTEPGTFGRHLGPCGFPYYPNPRCLAPLVPQASSSWHWPHIKSQGLEYDWASPGARLPGLRVIVLADNELSND